MGSEKSGKAVGILFEGVHINTISRCDPGTVFWKGSIPFASILMVQVTEDLLKPRYECRARVECEPHKLITRGSIPLSAIMSPSLHIMEYVG